MSDDAAITWKSDEGSIGREFGIDVDGSVPAIRRHLLLSQVLAAMTQRMLRTLLRSHQLSNQLGHGHVGTEHVLLAILSDPDSFPRNILGEEKANEVCAAVREVITSDSYTGYRGRPNEAR